MAVTITAMLGVNLLTSGFLLLVSQPRVDRCTELTRESRLAHESMLDSETGLRGWLATGDDVFLEPYQQSREAADESSDSLLALASGDASTVRPVVDMLLARTSWQVWAATAEQMEVSEQARSTGEVTTVLLEGKELFDRYREADQKATDLIVSRRDRALLEQRTALVAAVLVNVGAAAIAAVRAQVRRRRLARTILRPVAGLLTTIDALRSGDLAVRAPATDVRELAAVGSALGSLAGALHDAGQLAAARETRLALLAERLETVVRVAREISGSLSVRYVSESVTEAASALVGVPTALWVRTEDGAFVVARRSQDPHGAPAPGAVAGREPDAVVLTTAAEATTTSTATSRAYPLVLAGMVVGVLVLETPEVDADTEQVLDALRSTAAAALESARLHSAARVQADLDAMTQLPNRRRMETDLRSAWDRSSRPGCSLAFVMIDLDHFKRLNDDHGHLVGDAVLHEVATALLLGLRKGDSAYRYGGEELALLLPDTGLDEAARIAERVRAAVADIMLPGSAAHVTASLGVAARTAEMHRPVDLIEAADAALYSAKRSGRNRVATVAARVAVAEPAT